MPWPVFAPSKGRAGRVGAAVVSLTPTFLVEEPERAAYAAAYGATCRVEAFPEVDRGVAFARNQVLDAAARATEGWFWMVDDDAVEFWLAGSGTEEPRLCTAAEALGLVEEVVTTEEGRPGGERLAMAGLPILWRRDALDGQLVWNTHCYCCVALHAGRIGSLRYHEPLRLKEDTDFVLQVLSAGWKTLRCQRAAFRGPVCGTEPGGLMAEYRRGRERQYAELLRDRWPGIVTLGPKAVKPRIAWERFGGSASGVPRPSRPGRVGRAGRRPIFRSR
jgi:hypothetical protein